ncbi:hypothetical protein AB6A40_000466 [Gnathostoma spinigerum]|uniref:Uncharacterized protein n=1 Tax=Gnathostoma spinigerum TaxID=75299 RepID=A0ABD6EAP9_9BILA
MFIELTAARLEEALVGWKCSLVEGLPSDDDVELFPMGACLCIGRRRRRPSVSSDEENLNNHHWERYENAYRHPSTSNLNSVLAIPNFNVVLSGRDKLGPNVQDDVRDLIRQTLTMIRSLVSNEQEPPSSLLKLNFIADKEVGWILVVMCLLDTVPVDDPLGPAVITLFLDEGPLPTKETVVRLITRHLRLDDTSKRRSPCWHRNACIVLGCLAEKLAGSSSVQLCTNTTLTYLIDNLNPNTDPQVILYALIALEKFAQTSENRLTICRHFEYYDTHPLMLLESWLSESLHSDDWLKQQVAFCAQWSLDNIFVSNARELSYTKIDVSQINAMLNHEDVSEYLKIGPNGLEVIISRLKNLKRIETVLYA